METTPQALTVAPAETPHRTALCHYTTIRLATRQPTEFIDQTDLLQTLVEDSRVRYGILNIQTLHTTTAIVVNEHEPLLLTDFQALLEAAAPRDGRYRHDDTSARTVNISDEERPNGHAHCRALLLPCSASLNVARGRLLLGQWQRVFLVELDGPREREISVLIYGENWQ